MRPPFVQKDNKARNGNKKTQRTAERECPVSLRRGMGFEKDEEEEEEVILYFWISNSRSGEKRLEKKCLLKGLEKRDCD